MIRLRGFGWRYAGRRAWAVRGVDLDIARGERVLLLGGSGAGKSTLLHALAGLLTEDSGEREGHCRVDAGTGVVFQDPASQLVMARCGDDVAFGPENLGVRREEIWVRVREALDAVGFRHPSDRPTGTLSGGEAQRLALAGALALRPGLLLLDEPTANLDPAGAVVVRSALARALAGRDTTMILVEHRITEVLPLVDRVVVIEPGAGVLADGPPGEIFDRYGDRLSAEGAWIPGYRVASRRAAWPPGATLLDARQVHVPSRLSPVDVSVSAGEAVAVLGPNGSGKSTLALVLGGLLAPVSGRVTATAELIGAPRAIRRARRSAPIGDAPHRWRAADLARRIGSVFQDPRQQFVTSTVWDDLALGPRRTGASPATVRSTVDDLLDRLRLSRLARANPHTLSGGEARRLSVATALACAPGLLVLDEPTFGQDRRTWTELIDLLAGLRDEGRGLVTVTHDPDVVAALADRTVTLPDPAHSHPDRPAGPADPRPDRPESPDRDQPGAPAAAPGRDTGPRARAVDGPGAGR